MIFIVIGGGSVIAFFVVRAIFANSADQQPRQQAVNIQSSADINSMTLTDQQTKAVKIETATLREFAAEREAVGYIDFNQDRTAPVFSAWQGRVKQVLFKAGDDVKAGDVLLTMDSPDLVQAESNLIATSGIYRLVSSVLDRAQKMAAIQAISQKDLEQAISDQQAAEGNYKAARDAVRIFGKSPVEIDKIIASRKIDGELAVVSPLAGRVTARNAAVGVLLQPGTAPAPFTVADISKMWMTASVSEYDIPKIRRGQRISATVAALPAKKFAGVITSVGASVDPGTHRVIVRSEIADPAHELVPQMLATFTIRTDQPTRSVAVPTSGVVREGDGSMVAFVTKDGRKFERRALKVGIEQDGLQQISEGVLAGEKVATEGAIFLSNTLALRAR